MKNKVKYHKCPGCGKKLANIVYTTYGRKNWNGKDWVEDNMYGSMNFSCPKCGYELEYEELEEKEVL